MWKEYSFASYTSFNTISTYLLDFIYSLETEMFLAFESETTCLIFSNKTSDCIYAWVGLYFVIYFKSYGIKQVKIKLFLKHIIH